MLMVAMALHLALTIFIYLSGRFAFLASEFDVNGISVLSDSSGYRAEAISLADILAHKGTMAWITASSSFHVKLYSVCFLLFGSWFNYSILTAEPLNLLYLVLILSLVFKLGQEVFDWRAGALAAGITALWPSLLIHTTQLLRDPLFIVAMLGLVVVNVRWLTRIYTLTSGPLTAAAGGAFGLVLWLVRAEMWEVVLVVAALGTGLLVLRQLSAKQRLTGNIVGALMLLAVLITIPRLVPVQQHKSVQTPAANSAVEHPLGTESTEHAQEDLRRPATASANPTGAAPGHPTRAARVGCPGGTPAAPPRDLGPRIEFLRNRFIKYYPNAGSNIDTHVHFSTATDIAWYLPRAIFIGFLAPFPNMWFVPGAQVSLAVRLLGGLETVVMYGIELLALFAVWQNRHRLCVWLLVLVAGAGVTALGLVVVNIGALYRMRYVFWILLVVLGAGGVMQLLSTRHSKPQV